MMVQKQNTSKIYRVALTAALSAVLAACGGGGGGGSTASTAPVTPVTPSNPSVQVSTTIQPTTYATTSMQASLYAQLNARRLAMGVGTLAQDPFLDNAAAASALYNGANFATGALTALEHTEVSTLLDFDAATPLARAQAAGAPATEWIGEDLAAGVPQASQAAYATNCLARLLPTVYHLQDLTNSAQTLGIGFQQSSGSFVDYVCALLSGQTAGVTGTPSANGLLVAGGQQMAITTVAFSPLSGETGVPLAMVPEDTNAAPDLSSPGTPIMVRVNAANVGDVLKVSTFMLTTTGGALVPTRIIVPQAAVSGSTAAGVTADVNGLLAPGVAFLLPLTALTANTTYNVQFAGTRDNAGVTATWSFTTGS